MTNTDKHSKEYNILGIMSGTSLDGLDLALCSFRYERGRWHYVICDALTLPYNKGWKSRLQNAPNLSGMELALLDREYGEYIAQAAKDFIRHRQLDLIASHGHTVFHRPELKMTLQTGHAAPIAALTALPVVSDFRSMDVALGGQGAPLVPAGDELLFSEYDYCLNLGGFANISCKKNNKRIAWDICPANIILNKLAPPYDKDGEKGRSGKLNNELLNELNSLLYYHKAPPKSLGREWLEANFESVLNKFSLSEEDMLISIYEHIGIQISSSVGSEGNVLVTGGGAWNSFLMEIIRSKSSADFIIPDEKLVNYKEALIFAFLGLLRIKNEINCLASVTGASKDSSGGIVSGNINFKL